MTETIIQWIASHGYGVIFVLFALGIFGLPLPNDWLLAYLGYLVYKGRLLPAPTVAAAVLGALCGMTVNYLLGRAFGLYLVGRFGSVFRVTTEKMERMRDWFERWGRWGLLFGYYLPGVRHLIAFAAGTSKMPFGKFSLFGYAGGLLWCGTFIAFGYFFEEHWSRETQRIQHMLEIGSLAVIALAGGYLLVKKIQGRRSGPAA